MIDILTTRFHDAYSYLVSEDVSRQNDNNNDIMKKKTSINRFNNEHIKYTKSETTLKDPDQVSCVINKLINTLFSSMTQFKSFFKQLSNGYGDTQDDDSSILPIDGLSCRDCSKNTDRVSIYYFPLKY